MHFFATAAKGTEPALRDELRALRFRDVRADRGGVHFEGGLVDAARACLWSRVALRILLELSSFEASSADALYDGLRRVEWTQWVSPRTTVAVRATCRSSQLTHSQYVAQRAKDAIVDSVRERRGERPSVDKADPDVLVAIHLARDRATTYLDVSGGSLHERGRRAGGGEAPLRETLAAALLRLSGWDRERPLVDPMCGAGTIAVEAAAWSRGMAPGLSRPRFGLERWESHDAPLARDLAALRAEAKEAPRARYATVVARDVDPNAIELTRRNARAAGVELVIEQAGVHRLRPLEPPGFVVTNPPYGARLEADAALYADLARACLRLPGHTIALLAGTPEIARAMRREPDRWWRLYNGPIECRFLVFDLPP